MAEVINLRTARKRAERRQDEERAAASRLAHGQSKNARQLEASRQAKANRDLEGHRVEGGDQ